MIFATLEDWEETNPFICAVNKPFKLHRAIELMLSMIFYILELRIRTDKHITFRRTFLIEDFETVLCILKDTPAENHLLSIFVPGSFTNKKQNSIHVIKKILREQNKETMDLYVYECSDGEVIMNMEFDNNNLSRKNMKCIYNSKSKTF